MTLKLGQTTDKVMNITLHSWRAKCFGLLKAVWALQPFFPSKKDFILVWGSVDCFRSGMLTLLPAEIAWFSLVLILKQQISLINGKGWKPVKTWRNFMGNAGLYWITYCKSDKGNCKQNRAGIRNWLLMTYLLFIA